MKPQTIILVILSIFDTFFSDLFHQLLFSIINFLSEIYSANLVELDSIYAPYSTIPLLRAYDRETLQQLYFTIKLNLKF